MIFGLLLLIINISGFSISKMYRTQGLQYIDIDLDQFSQSVSGQTTLSIILENTSNVSYTFLGYCFNNDEQIVKSILSSLNSIQYHIESNKKQCLFDNNALLYYQTIQQLVFTNNIDQQNEWIYSQYSVYQLKERKVRVYVYSSLETSYRITIKKSEKGECYNSCNNQGQCREKAVNLCQCQPGILDSTCQLTSNVVSIKSKSQFSMEKQSENIFLIPIHDITSNLVIKIESSIEVKLYIGCQYEKLYIPFDQSNSYHKQIISNGKLLFTIEELQNCFENANLISQSLEEQLSKNLIVLLVNEKVVSNNIILITTSEDSEEEEQSSIEMIYIISCLLGSLIILIVIIILIIYRKRKVKRIFIIQPNSERANTLKAKKFRHSLKQDYIATEIYDQIIQDFPGLLETEDCQICLLQFKKQDLVKLTYCLHLFHQFCLDEWRKRTQTCPFCRSNLTQEKYMQQIQEEQIIRLGVIVDDAIQIDPQKLQYFQQREQRIRQLQQTQSPGSANVIQINTPGLCQFSEN